MNMQLAIALLPYIAVFIGLSLFLGLFLGTARQLQKLRGRIANLEAQARQATDPTQGIEGLKHRIEELEIGAPEGEISPNRAGSLNRTVRSKVLKMHRLGQSPERISENLRVPKGEVDLLVKVHQIAMRPYEQTPARALEGEAG